MKDNQGLALKMILKSGNRGVTVRQLFDAGINDVYGTIKNLRKKKYPIESDPCENLTTGLKWVNYWISKKAWQEFEDKEESKRLDAEKDDGGMQF